MAPSRDGDGDVSRQRRKGLDPVAIVTRIDFDLGDLEQLAVRNG